MVAEMEVEMEMGINDGGRGCGNGNAFILRSSMIIVLVEEHVFVEDTAAFGCLCVASRAML